MELSAIAGAATKEISAVITLVRDLIRIDQVIGSEVDKRQIRQLCRDLRVIYFSPDGVIGELRRFVEHPPKNHGEFVEARSRIKWAYWKLREEVDESLKRLRELKAEKNLEISLELYEFAWRVGLGKGRWREAIGSVLRYTFDDLDKYDNDPKLVLEHMREIIRQVDAFNRELAELEGKLRALT